MAQAVGDGEPNAGRSAGDDRAAAGKVQLIHAASPVSKHEA
jgi:hypothetical protein